MIRSTLFTILAVVLLAAAIPASAQTLNIAVIDVQRVVTESDPGKEALQKLKELQDAKIDQGRAMQQELATMQEQINKQQFTLSDEKLGELRKTIEDKGIEMQRFQDDAERELDEARRRELGGLEGRIIPVINQIGAERGYTLIFNKFQSGLVYADDAVDITDDVILHFNTTQ